MQYQQLFAIQARTSSIRDEYIGLLHYSIHGLRIFRKNQQINYPAINLLAIHDI
jgi:hypothetical protein